MSEEYLNDAAFFLTAGEQAPFKSAADIDELTLSNLKYWVNKLIDMYQRQKEEMEKARRK